MKPTSSLSWKVLNDLGQTHLSMDLDNQSTGYDGESLVAQTPLYHTFVMVSDA